MENQESGFFKLRQTVRFFEALLRASADGIAITDSGQNIIFANDTFCDLFCSSRQNLTETCISACVDKLGHDAHKRWNGLVSDVHELGVVKDVEFSMDTKTGIKNFAVNSSLLKSADFDKGIIISIWRDITKRKRAEDALLMSYDELEERVRKRTAELSKANDELHSEIAERKLVEEALRKSEKKLEVLAATDTLTQTYNRLKFNELLSQEIQRAERYTIPLSIIMFDLDNFKRINDTWGHHKGDEVLKEISRIVLGNLRTTDKLARWGGEEFIILAPETNLERAKELAERLRIAATGDNIFKNLCPVSCSFGVAEFRENDTEETFSKRADDALYEAKHTGKNKVCCETPLYTRST